MGQRGKTAKIDLNELEKLASLQCTDEEIALWFGVTTRTIERRRKVRKFAEAMERGKARGRISVRRMQMKLLEEGNATMGVWLGKQLLGQTDQVWHEVNQNHNFFITSASAPLPFFDPPETDGDVLEIAPETTASGGESAKARPLALPAPRR
jgi:hypothetical protein